MHTALLDRLSAVEELARGSRYRRWRARPLAYPLGLLHRDLLYRFSRRGWEVECRTFFGASMQLVLPSGLDIYLTGGKTHDSELRLARYLIGTLQAAEVCIDIGAHYGYFSLLSSQLVGAAGKVISIEASPATYRTLRANVAHVGNVNSLNIAAAAAEELLTFYEFPPLFAEYNSFDAQQYYSEPWYPSNLPTQITVPGRSLDTLTAAYAPDPTLIKIDVEGAEERVLRGAVGLLERASPTIVMEYLGAGRQQENHRRAAGMLGALNYRPYSISPEGQLVALRDIPAYLARRGLESDNIVFRK